jgi:hypothetical protein
MRNRVTISLDKSVYHSGNLTFSTRHTQEQVKNWLNDMTRYPEYWDEEVDWDEGYNEDVVEISCDDFEEGKGDDDEWFEPDEVIQEWIDEQK